MSSNRWAKLIHTRSYGSFSSALSISATLLPSVIKFAQTTIECIITVNIWWLSQSQYYNIVLCQPRFLDKTSTVLYYCSTPASSRLHYLPWHSKVKNRHTDFLVTTSIYRVKNSFCLSSCVRQFEAKVRLIWKKYINVYFYTKKSYFGRNV